MSKALRIPDYLGHILEAIERIDRYTADLDQIGFLGNPMVQDAVIRNIEIHRRSGKQFPAHGTRLRCVA